MQEATTPILVPVPQAGNLSNLIADRAWSEPQRIVMSRPIGDGWESVTAKTADEEIRAAAKGLIAAGVSHGDRVAIMARTRYEWTILDFAIWSAGAVTVPIYETSSAEQVEWILRDSEAVGVIAETLEHKKIIESVKPQSTLHLWTIDDGAITHLRNAGTHISDDEVSDRRASLDPNSLATLIYTSGTTGRPKGCELTHGNFLAEVGNVTKAAEDLFYRADASTLLFLPLAHVFGRLIGVGSAYSGLHLAHCADVVNNLSKDMSTFKPRFILSVPRVFEKVYNGAEAKADAAGKGDIFRKAAAVAIGYSEGLESGKISLGLRIKHKIFDKLVFTKIRAALGGNATHAISGGAPLGARLGHFFRGVGITVLEGYGLTETTAGATLNLTNRIRVGSVGRPLPGTTIRIAEDGEVLIKGPIVFRGYWKNPEATREAFTEDGWFKSGDLGRLDDDGYLYIVGRKKEIIVTAGGKNVAPAVLEDRLRSNALVSQCVVVGDNKPFIGVLITLDPEALPIWAHAQGKSGLSPAELRKDPQLLASIQAAVDEANKAVSKAESIRKFVILENDLTIASGHLTPKLSIKRNVVIADFAKQIEELYQNE